MEVSLHFLILKLARSHVSLHAKQTTKKPLDEVNKPQRQSYKTFTIIGPGKNFATESESIYTYVIHGYY